MLAAPACRPLEVRGPAPRPQDRERKRSDREREPQRVVDRHLHRGARRARISGGDRVQRDDIDQTRDVGGDAGHRGRRDRRVAEPLREPRARSVGRPDAPLAPGHADPPLVVADRERQGRHAGDEVEERRERRPAEGDAGAVEGEHQHQPHHHAPEEARDQEEQQRAPRVGRLEQRDHRCLARRGAQAAHHAQRERLEAHAGPPCPARLARASPDPAETGRDHAREVTAPGRLRR